MPCFCPQPVWNKKYSFTLGRYVLKTDLPVQDVYDRISNASFVYDDDGQHIQEILRDDIRGTSIEKEFFHFLKYYGCDVVFCSPRIRNYLRVSEGIDENIEYDSGSYSYEWLNRYQRYKRVCSMSQVEIQQVQSFIDRFDLYPIRYFPCGFCEGCLQRRATDWGMRCDLEMKSHKFNCFITLTYNEENIPINHGLFNDHLQKFWKRLRNNLNRKPSFRFLIDCGCDLDFKYFASGEYGGQPDGFMNRPFGRPHYHAIIFGLDFLDKVPFKRTGSGFWQCTSELLSECWPYGYATVGESANFCTARYVAKYIQSDMFIRDFNLREYRSRYFCHPPFTVSSNRPGIGAKYFEENLGKSLFNCFSNLNDFDKIIGTGGVRYRVPRYYLKLLKKAVENGKFDAEMFQRYQSFREEQIIKGLSRSLPYPLYCSRYYFLNSFESKRQVKRSYIK